MSDVFEKQVKKFIANILINGMVQSKLSSSENKIGG